MDLKALYHVNQNDAFPQYRLYTKIPKDCLKIKLSWAILNLVDDEDVTAIYKRANSDAKFAGLLEEEIGNEFKIYLNWDLRILK